MRTRLDVNYEYDIDNKTVQLIIIVHCHPSSAGDSPDPERKQIADRTLILVRHGQYDLKTEQLTDLGEIILKHFRAFRNIYFFRWSTIEKKLDEFSRIRES